MILFARIAMRLFLLGMICHSDIPSCSLFFWVFSDDFLNFSAYVYVSFFSILPAFAKERIILQSGHIRHIYNIGESLSTSPV